MSNSLKLAFLVLLLVCTLLSAGGVWAEGTSTAQGPCPPAALEHLSKEVENLASRLGLELEKGRSQSRGAERTVVYTIVGEPPEADRIARAVRDWVEANGGAVDSTFVAGETALIEASGVELGEHTVRKLRFVLGKKKLALSATF